MCDESRRKTKRETKYDKLMHAVVFARDAFRVKRTAATDEFADFMEQMIQTGDSYAAASSKSQVAALFMPEFLEMLRAQIEDIPGDASHPNRVAARESLEYFYECFPAYLQKRNAKRDKVIERNKIRNSNEFYLIQDYIFELEGKKEGELLAKLYELVDNAEI
ncbi:MAG: hypothetical protein AAFO81_11445 [Pseudomonadota bacterium]